jgi:phosphomannomutase/phosphoglucomutase
MPASVLKHPLGKMPAHIFRAYDIRGVVDTDLTESIVHDIGLGLGSVAQELGETSLIVGRDGRLSGPKLGAALKEGILASGCNVVDIGIVPTPLMYFATKTLGVKSGVMLTGSHNPSNYNGIKMVMQDVTFSETQIQELYQRLQQGKVRQGKGSLREQPIIQAYIDYIASSVTLPRKLKVVVDSGNGVPGLVMPKLCRALGCEVIELFCDVDGRFPNHHPDPTRPENLVDLVASVKKYNADIGLALDGDGDRLGVVSNTGNILWADRQLMLYAKDILSRHPGAKIIYDVKCSKNVAAVVEACGGIPIMTKTGHSFMKAKLRETGAALAGELSGHVAFNDHWFGFDDGLYTGVRMLEVLAKQSKDADSLFADIPDSITTPEFHVHIAEDKKFGYMNTLLKHAAFPHSKTIDIDGLRVEFSDAWGLVRASNTTPCLVCRFEADTEAALKRVQGEFRAFMLKYDPTLKIPF